MKRLKQALSLGMAGVMMTAAPVTAFAASPEFSRSAEEWARLQDNTIEYDETGRPDPGIQRDRPEKCH